MVLVFPLEVGSVVWFCLSVQAKWAYAQARTLTAKLFPVSIFKLISFPFHHHQGRLFKQRHSVLRDCPTLGLKLATKPSDLSLSRVGI